jgi:amino acid ABC transporter periplasmic protein
MWIKAAMAHTIRRFFHYQQGGTSIMKKVFAVILSALMLLSCASAMAEGTFRVGMECNYAPYNWTQAEPSEFTVPIEGGGGYADGYDVQIAKLIAEGLGKELVIVKTEWDGLPMGVMSGAFDAIIAGMSPTEERKATLDFSDPYRTNKLVVVVKKDSPYASATSLEELSGATITGQLNTFHYTVIDQISGVNKAMAMETFPAMIVAVQSGAVDGYVAEEDGAQADTAANPDLTYIKFDEGKGFEASEADTSIAVGLAKGSDLLGPINEILAGIDDATRDELMAGAKERQPLNQ